MQVIFIFIFIIRPDRLMFVILAIKHNHGFSLAALKLVLLHHKFATKLLSIVFQHFRHFVDHKTFLKYIYIKILSSTVHSMVHCWANTEQNNTKSPTLEVELFFSFLV